LRYMVNLPIRRQNSTSKPKACGIYVKKKLLVCYWTLAAFCIKLSKTRVGRLKAGKVE